MMSTFSDTDLGFISHFVTSHNLLFSCRGTVSQHTSDAAQRISNFVTWDNDSAVFTDSTLTDVT